MTKSTRHEVFLFIIISPDTISTGYLLTKFTRLVKYCLQNIHHPPRKACIISNQPIQTHGGLR
jgi:hypothetical protein